LTVIVRIRRFRHTTALGGYRIALFNF
jgi:hypothetical protein